MKNIKSIIAMSITTILIGCSSTETKELFYEVVGTAILEKEINKDQNVEQSIDLGYSAKKCLSVKGRCSGSYTEWLQNSNEKACRCIKPRHF